jgi:tRNA pseudouridine32 synthase/23S rRNA pseudouridine746 synthase
MPLPTRRSTLYLPAGPWATVLDCLCAHFSAIDRDTWLERMARGKVLDEHEQPIGPEHPYKQGLRIHYFREVPNETPVPFEETVLYVDDHLIVADKPHFLSVTPAGEYVEQTLLARLSKRFGSHDLVPLHRIDRLTAGLVLFSVQPQTRAAYQRMFAERSMHKTYEAIAPALPLVQFPHLHKTRMVAGEPFFLMKEGDGTPNSETLMEVRERNGELWRYGLYPVTGKKHQLRLHLAALGAGICNDPFYPQLAKDAVDDYSKPLKLLAQSLRFIDPLSGIEREFHSQLKLDW